MKTKQEIIDYLGIEEENLKEYKKEISTAMEIEKSYAIAIEKEEMGYCLEGDYGIYVKGKNIVASVNGLIVYEEA